MTTKSSPNPISIGIIGVGRGGQDQVAWIAKLKSEFRLTAVCDADLKRAMSVAEPHGAVPYSELREFLKHPDLELVTIANRSVDHFATAMACMKAGKHVLVEKPVTITAAGARRLVNFSRRTGVRLFVHHNRRFDPGFVKVQDILRSGILGTVQQIKLRRLSYQRRNDWQTLKEFGGGQLLNWGPHIIDHALVLLGSPVIDQWSQLRKVAAAGDCEDHLLINLLGRNGRYASVEISGGTAIGESPYHIVGSKGTLIGGDKELKLKYLDPAQKLRPPRAKKSTPQGYGSGEDLKWIEETVIPEPPRRTIWHALFDAVRRNKQYPISNDHVIEIMRVIDRAKMGTPFASPVKER